MNAKSVRPVVRVFLVAALVFLLLVASLLGETQEAQAATLQRLTVEQMAEVADTILLARTISTRTEQVAPGSAVDYLGGIQTVIDLQVLNALKGAAGPEVTLTVPGGSVGNLRVVADWVPSFAPGETSLLFLDGQGRVIGGPQGKLTVVEDMVSALKVSLGVALGRIDAAVNGTLSAQARSRSTEVIDATGPSTVCRKADGALRDRVSSETGPSTASVIQQVQAQGTLLYEGFESGASKWKVAGTPTWGIWNHRASAGSKSAYCDNSSSSPPHAPNMNAFLVAGPFDFSDVGHISLEFDFYVDSELNHDWLWAQASTDGLTYGNGKRWSGDWSEWNHARVSFDEFAGQQRVWIAFVYTSDSTVNREGAYVDEVQLITEGAQQPSGPVVTGMSPSSASAGTNTRVTVQGSGFGSTRGSGSVNFYYDGESTLAAPIVSWTDNTIVCVVPTENVDSYPASAGSGPVTVTNSSGKTSAGHDFHVTFGYLGKHLAVLSAPYRVNANTADTPDEEAMVDAATATWGEPTALAFVDTGACGSTSYASGDGHSDIFWSASLLQYGVLSGSVMTTLAATVPYPPWWSAGEIISEFDICFNDSPQMARWGDGSGGTADVQAIALHELGHCLGLRDLYGPGDSAKAMYGWGGPGQWGPRALHEDDVTGVEWIYEAAPPQFADVSAAHPYCTAVGDLSARGIITGYTDGTFRPNNPVTRQQFAKMIVKTLGLAVTGNETCPFGDVESGRDTADPLYPDKYVAVCALHSITVGTAPYTFSPYSSITRQQLITMVTRATGLPDPAGAYAPDFVPGQFYPHEHYLNARRAASAGLLDGLQGVGPGYDFFASATRGECAQILHNLLHQ